ncbi:MAG: hypothetical protein ACLUG1_00690 [Christensenellales bacterium]
MTSRLIDRPIRPLFPKDFERCGSRCHSHVGRA